MGAAYGHPMATVILARHGRTQANAAGVLAGRGRGIHLDDIGHEQAVRAAKRLEGVPLAAAVTSPADRCRETSKILLNGSGQSAQVEKRLHECDYGDWTGQEIKHLVKDKLWKVVQSQPSAVRFPGGESMAQMSARAVAAVRDWDSGIDAEVGPGAVWLAVSHGDLIKAVLADALGMHLDAFQRIHVDPASLSVINYTPRRTSVLMMNTVSGSLEHLAKLASKPRSRKASLADQAIPGGGPGPELLTP